MFSCVFCPCSIRLFSCSSRYQSSLLLYCTVLYCTVHYFGLLVSSQIVYLLLSSLVPRHPSTHTLLPSLPLLHSNLNFYPPIYFIGGWLLIPGLVVVIVVTVVVRFVCIGLVHAHDHRSIVNTTIVATGETINPQQPAGCGPHTSNSSTPSRGMTTTTSLPSNRPSRCHNRTHRTRACPQLPGIFIVAAKA